MAAKRVIEGVHVIPMGRANAFLIEGDDGLTLIDAGFPGKEATVFEAVRGLGHSLDQLKHLIFTHHHSDHIGSAAAIVRQTGARTYMHPLDSPMAESGGPFRPMSPAPGVLRQVMCRLFYDHNERVAPVAIDQPLIDGDIAAHRWRHRSYSYTWALRGTGRAFVASGTNAARRRCGHEPHGARRSRRLRKFTGRPCEPAQTRPSFIRCCRIWPWRAHRPRCVHTFPQ